MTNFIRKALCGVSALLVAGVMTTSVSQGADLKDPGGVGGTAATMGGPYIAISAAANGTAADGKAYNADGNTNGTMGKVFGSAAIQVGWVVPVAPNLLIGIDGHFQPGDGKINFDAGTGNEAGADAEDVAVEISDMATISIMPMFVTSENSAFYIKAGWSHADLTWSGDVLTNVNLGDSAHGYSGAVGNRTLFGTNGFIQTEFGVSDFATVSVHKKSTVGRAAVNPKNVYGALSIGVRY